MKDKERIEKLEDEVRNLNFYWDDSGIMMRAFNELRGKVNELVTEIHECPNCRHRTMNEYYKHYPTVTNYHPAWRCLTCGKSHRLIEEKRYDLIDEQ